MKIRFHHLLCIPRFCGNGYSSSFCSNLSDIKSRFEAEPHEYVIGCDDVCKACPNNIGGVCANEQKVRKYDLAVKKALDCGEAPLLQNICSDCEWYYICEKISLPARNE